MTDELAGLFIALDVVVDQAMEQSEPDIHAVHNAIQDIKDYLSTKEITEPKRKCWDDTHHFKGCDCW